MDRDAAVDRVGRILDTVEREPLPVPIREVWVYGDLALGVDPVDRLDVYVTKDLLLGGGETTDAKAAGTIPDVDGIGETVSAAWAARHPDRVRANEHGHAAPERCLAAHLIGDDEPIHLEVCNAGFGDNVVQRLRAAQTRDAYDEALDPRGVCLWVDGQRDDEALRRLRESDFAFPPLSEAFGALGLDDAEAERAAAAVHAWRAESDGATVRGDVV
jgi:hypothetical protein